MAGVRPPLGGRRQRKRVRVTRFFTEVIKMSSDDSANEWRAIDLAAEYALEAFLDSHSDEEVKRQRLAPGRKRGVV